MKITDILKNAYIEILKVHPESEGYFNVGSIGQIDFIDRDGSVCASFSGNNRGPLYEHHSVYIGTLNEHGELFRIISLKSNLSNSHNFVELN